jgi:hypothetical protein
MPAADTNEESIMTEYPDRDGDDHYYTGSTPVERHDDMHQPQRCLCGWCMSCVEHNSRPYIPDDPKPSVVARAVGNAVVISFGDDEEDDEVMYGTQSQESAVWLADAINKAIETALRDHCS